MGALRETNDRDRDTWQLQEAKARFSELVDRALAEGPQHVTRRGERTVVIVSAEHFAKFNEPTKDNWLTGSKIKFDDEFCDLLDSLRDNEDVGRDVDLGDLIEN